MDRNTLLKDWELADKDVNEEIKEEIRKRRAENVMSLLKNRWLKMSDYEIKEYEGHIYICPTEDSNIEYYNTSDKVEEILESFLHVIEKTKTYAQKILFEKIDKLTKLSYLRLFAQELLPFVKRYGLFGIYNEMIQEDRQVFTDYYSGPQMIYERDPQFVKINMTCNIAVYLSNLIKEYNMDESHEDLLYNGSFNRASLIRLFCPEAKMFDDATIISARFKYFLFDSFYSEDMGMLLHSDLFLSFYYLPLASNIGQLGDLEVNYYVLNDMHPFILREDDLDEEETILEDKLKELRYPDKDGFHVPYYDLEKYYKTVPTYLKKGFTADTDDSQRMQFEGFHKMLSVHTGGRIVALTADFQNKQQLLYDAEKRNWRLVNYAESLLGIIKNAYNLSLVSESFHVKKCALVGCPNIISATDNSVKYCSVECGDLDRKRKKRAIEKQNKATKK